MDFKRPGGLYDRLTETWSHEEITTVATWLGMLTNTQAELALQILAYECAQGGIVAPQAVKEAAWAFWDIYDEEAEGETET